MSKPWLMVSGGSSALTSTSSASRSLTARAYSTRLSRWNGRRPGFGAQRRRAIDPRLERLDQREQRGVRRDAARRAAASCRRAACGSSSRRPRRAAAACAASNDASESAAGFASLAVAPGAVLLDEQILRVDDCGQWRRPLACDRVGAPEPSALSARGRGAVWPACEHAGADVRGEHADTNVRFQPCQAIRFMQGQYRSCGGVDARSSRRQNLTRREFIGLRSETNFDVQTVKMTFLSGLSWPRLPTDRRTFFNRKRGSMRRGSTHSALSMFCVLAAAIAASAQVQTGSIAGVATDTSNAVMPGVTVSVSGDKLIGGVQTQTTDASGAYRFDRLPPGTYNVKFELQGFKHDRARRHRDQRVVHRDREREARGRQRERDDHGHRRVADRRHQVEPAADGHDPGGARRHSVGPRSVVGGQGHPRRPGLDLRRRRHAVVSAELALGARVEHQRRQLQHRRRDGELAGRRRRRDDDVLRPGDVRRGQLHDVGDSRRSHGRRRLDQHGHQGRRQQVARRHALQLLDRLSDAAEPAAGLSRERQPERRAGARARQPDAVRLRLELRRRRRAGQGSAVGQRLGPPLDHQQAGQREERRRHARRSTTTR